MTDQQRYPQVLRAVSETPWAIRPEKLAVIQELLSLRASGHRLTQADIEARIGSGPAQKPQSKSGSVAVIPIYGVISPKADFFTQVSGGTSMQGFMDSLRMAAADDSIDAILLDIDSPGGSVSLIPEAAAEIANARAAKPVVAIANTMAASAAYWLGSQADELVISPSGEVGSIGVYSAHQDISGMLEQDGVAMTLISAGKYKVENTPYGPLSDEAAQAIQDDVDAYYEMFVNAVADGRGVSADAVRSGFGEGRMVMAQKAVAGGMADRIDTFEGTVERLIVQAATAGPSARGGSPPRADNTANDPGADGALSFAQTAVALRESADQLVADAGALRVLTAAKRDVLSAVSESLAGSSAALVELLARTDDTPPVLSEAERDHIEKIRSAIR